MDPEIKERWIAALRSGEYQQGRGTLRRINDDSDRATYCCLGVLCDLAEQAGVEMNSELVSGEDGVSHVTSYNETTKFLPEAVMDWADTKHYNPVVGAWPAGGAGTRNLSSLNDSGFTFDEIADLIEEYL